MNLKNFSLVLFIPLLLLFVSCDKTKLYGELLTDDELVQSLYSLSTDTLIIDNQKLVLEAELYRDFFPGGIVQRSTRLVALIFLRNIDDLAISDKLEIRKLYVINQKQIWISKPVDSENAYLPEYKISRKSTDGPEWETDITVDVLIKIENKINAQFYYLIAKEQLIVRTE